MDITAYPEGGEVRYNTGALFGWFGEGPYCARSKERVTVSYVYIPGRMEPPARVFHIALSSMNCSHMLYLVSLLLEIGRAHV